MNHLTPWEKDISSRLKSHRATPPAMGWEKLQRRMAEQSPANAPAKKPSGSKPAMPRWLRPAIYATALTAAASVALVFLIRPTAGDISIPDTPAAQAGSTHPDTHGPQEKTAPVRQTAHYPQMHFSSYVKTSGNHDTQARPADRASENIHESTASADVSNENAEALPQEYSDNNAGAAEKPHNSQKKEGMAIPFKTTSDNEEQLRHKLFGNAKRPGQSSGAKRPTAGHLAFSVHGAAPRSDNKKKDGYANPDILPDAAPTIASLDYASGDMSAIIANNILSDVDTHVRHHMPLQLGFSIAYALNKRWSLSTGITYTRLTTDIESGTESSYYLTSQRLHYVGLPVAARLTAFSSRYFDAYVSAGGMIEKCVDGEQAITYQMSESRKSSNGTAEHVGRGLWQASLNASAGVQFNILPSLGVFFEPGLTWYADDRSSLPNIRHDNPWQFTMQGGLRLTIGK